MDKCFALPLHFVFDSSAACVSLSLALFSHMTPTHPPKIKMFRPPPHMFSVLSCLVLCWRCAVSPFPFFAFLIFLFLLCFVLLIIFISCKFNLCVYESLMSSFGLKLGAIHVLESDSGSNAGAMQRLPQPPLSAPAKSIQL